MDTTKTASSTAAPKKSWKVETYSSGPLGIGDGVVYAPLVEGGTKHFAALDAGTGEARWKARGHINLPPRFAAAVTDGAVSVQRYAPKRPKVLVVMSRDTGTPLREVPCAGAASEALDESSAHVYGPFAIGQILVCVTYGPLAPALREVGRHADPPPRGHVTAIDPMTGRTVYDVELPEGVVPHTVLADGERVFVGGRRTASGASDEHQAWQGQVFALRGADGSPLWESDRGPALNAGGGGVVIADVRADRSRVQHTAAADHAPTELVAFDAATGAVRFRRAMPGGWGSFVVDDRIVCVEPHTDSAIALDIATGAQIWSTPSPHGEQLSPRPAGTHARSFAACAGRVWLTGSRGRIIGFDLADGTFHKTSARGFTLASDGEHLFIGDAASLTAFTFEATAEGQ